MVLCKLSGKVNPYSVLCSLVVGEAEIFLSPSGPPFSCRLCRAWLFPGTFPLYSPHRVPESAVAADLA